MPVDEEESIVDAVLKVQLNSNGVDNESPPRLNGNSRHQQHEEDETLEDPKEQSKQQQVGTFAILFLILSRPRDPGATTPGRGCDLLTR
jgi:hypothetical protein